MRLGFAWFVILFVTARQHVHLYIDRSCVLTGRTKMDIQNTLVALMEGFIPIEVSQVVEWEEQRPSLVANERLKNFIRYRRHKRAISLLVTTDPLYAPNHGFGMTVEHGKGCSLENRAAMVFHDGNYNRTVGRLAASIGALYSVLPAYSSDESWVTRNESMTCAYVPNSVNRYFFWRPPFDFKWTDCCRAWLAKYKKNLLKKCKHSRKCKRIYSFPQCMP